MSRPISASLAAFLLLSGCTREEATARVKDDILADSFGIIHARFPCRSSGLHFFGYRFRVKVKGEFGEGMFAGIFQLGNGLGAFCPSIASRASILATRV